MVKAEIAFIDYLTHVVAMSYILIDEQCVLILQSVETDAVLVQDAFPKQCAPYS